MAPNRANDLNKHCNAHLKKVSRNIMHLFSVCMMATLAYVPAHAETSGSGADSPLVVLGMSPVSEKSYETILQILLEDAVQSRREEGILSWDLFQPEDGKKDLLAMERYKNRATFDQHIEKPYVKVFIETIPTAVREGEEQAAIFMKDLLPATSKPIPSPQTTKNIIMVLPLQQESAEPVIKALLDVAKAARRENGNLVYNVSQEIEAPHRLVVFQRWTTSQAYEAHRRQARVVALDKLLTKSLPQPDHEIWRAVRDMGR
jgi:quinol monooxygenase YgiN